MPTVYVTSNERFQSLSSQVGLQDALREKLKHVGIELKDHHDVSLNALAECIHRRCRRSVYDATSLRIDEIEEGCLDAINQKISRADSAIAMARELIYRTHPARRCPLDTSLKPGFPLLMQWYANDLKRRKDEINQDKFGIQNWIEKYLIRFKDVWKDIPLRETCHEVYTMLQHPDCKTILKERNQAIYWTWYWQYGFTLPPRELSKPPVLPKFDHLNRDNQQIEVQIEMDTSNTILFNCLILRQLDSVEKYDAFQSSEGLYLKKQKELLDQFLPHLEHQPMDLTDLSTLYLYCRLKRHKSLSCFSEAWLNKNPRAEPTIRALELATTISSTEDAYQTACFWYSTISTQSKIVLPSNTLDLNTEF